MIRVGGGAERLRVRAVHAWGFASQVEMIAEECAELIAALNRWKRGRCDVGDVIDEIADVTIVLGYAIEMAGEAPIRAAIERKLARLEERVALAEAKAASFGEDLP